jgi:hypothetical protein
MKYTLEEIRDFFQRLYYYGKQCSTYNTQNAIKSILDSLIELTQHCIELQERISKLEKDGSCTTMK